MKNTEIMAAIATITRVVDAMERTEAGCEGITKEHTPYRQNLLDALAKVTKERDSWAQRIKAVVKERNDTQSGINALRVELESANDRLSARNTALVGWQTTAAGWEQRFHALMADMDGTVKALKEERAAREYMKDQLALKTKAADHLGKLYDASHDTIDTLNADLEAERRVSAALRADLRGRCAVLDAIQTACKG